MVAAIFAVAVVGRCAGESSEERDRNFVDGFCDATRVMPNKADKVASESSGEFTPEVLKRLAPVFSAYARDLEKLKPPRDVEESSTSTLRNSGRPQMH